MKNDCTKKCKRKEQKLQKKLHFYSEVRDTVSSLAIKKTINKKKRIRGRQKKLKAYDFSSLKKLLPEADVAPKPPDSRQIKIKCKNRNKLVETENKQFKAVINSSVFQADPFSAIHHHLQRTQSTVTGVETGEEAKTRRKRGRHSSGTQFMDM